jgi:phosphocarrier protein
MRVKASKGEVLHFRASGEDARQALDTIVDLVRRRFDEE